MARPTTTSPLNNPSHSALHNFHVDVRMFGAVGDGVADDTAAINAAVAASTNNGTIFFPAGAYKVTSTIDLSSVTTLHMIGGHTGAGTSLLQGQFPPAVYINGQTITTGPVFYRSGGAGANGSSHTWENFMVQAGRTGFHYKDTANVRFNNVSVRPYTTDGNSKNAAIVMENAFWGWFNDCCFHSPNGSATLPSVILLTENIIDSPGGLHRFHNVQFIGGSVEVQMKDDPPTYGNLYFENCETESSSKPMLTFTESGTTTPYNIVDVGMRNSGLSDSIGVSLLPMIQLNATNARLIMPVIENCRGVGQVAIQVTAGQVNGAFIASSWGSSSARYVVDNAMTTQVGSWMAMKLHGYDIVTDDSGVETDTTTPSNVGAAQRFFRPSEANARHGVSTSGKHYWGSGSAAYDTNLYRSAADTLKSDDHLLLSTDGSSTATPRAFGATDLTGVEAARMQLGDSANAVQIAGGSRAQFYGYWGLELRGSRQTVTPPSSVGGGAADPGVSVIADLDKTALLIKGHSGATADLQQWTNSGGTVLSFVDASGRVHVPVVATASLPAAAAAMNGTVLIEDAGAGDRNIIIYAGGERFRIDGGATF